MKKYAQRGQKSCPVWGKIAQEGEKFSRAPPDQLCVCISFQCLHHFCKMMHCFFSLYERKCPKIVTVQGHVKYLCAWFFRFFAAMFLVEQTKYTVYLGKW